MANVAHSTLTGANLHEPKGVASATAGTIYVADGAGSGSWVDAPITSLQGGTTGTSGMNVYSDGAGGIKVADTPHGSCTFVNTTTPNSTTTPTTFTKVAPTTVASGHGVEVTEATTARLTYSGLDSEHFGASASISFGHTASAARDISFALAKNGTVVASSEAFATCTNGIKQSVSIYTDVDLTTNDYVEVFTKIAGTGDVQVYCYNFVLEKI